MDRKIEKKGIGKGVIAGIVLAILAVAFFLFTYFGLDRRSSETVTRDRVMIREVIRDSFQEYIEVSGVVQPLQTTILDAVEGGVVQDVFVQSGETVTAGDTLITLSNSNLQLNVLQQEAGLYDQINNVRNSRLNLEQNNLRLREDLASAETQLDLLRPRFERDSSLFSQELISPQEFEETRQAYRFQQRRYQINYESYQKDSLQLQTQLTQLNNSEDRMWRSLEGVQQILNNLVVTAPISGQLSTVELNQGQSISQGERLGQIDQMDGYKVRVDIDEFYLSRVTAGLEGSFPFAGNRYDLAITRIYPVIQEGSFQVDMYFTGETPDGIRRGQTVRVRLELGDQTEAILLARGGFYQETGGNWIYKIDGPDNRAYRQPIRLGRGNTQYFEVLEGLSPGDSVIVSGYGSFNDTDVLVLE
ncbi:MAG TPA: HlyD family efflux transporter periplasmic adaptor subunit [Balneolaceae bacterium]|nr:HlyD family efflux transporter periplasmic adaptor subunit [Balneolaceae bacterium]